MPQNTARTAAPSSCEDAAELDPEPEEETPDYPVTIFVSREGYFKKITPQSLRMSGEQRFKEGDGLRFSCETTNAARAAGLLGPLPGL